MPLQHCLTITLSIACPPERVYDYVFDARNLPSWSFFRAVTPCGDHYEVETPDGTATLRFTPRNTLGVLDHTVTLPNGTTVHVPFRVIPNGDGSEVMLTVFQTPGMTPTAFATDAKQVARDLEKLKSLLE